VFVPLNPLLKGEQVAYILLDCNVRVLVTSPERLSLLTEVLRACRDLQHVVLTGAEPAPAAPPGLTLTAWAEVLATPPRSAPPLTDSDMLAILYTSGSTGRPKGVVLSHRNMVTGAKSVASYLRNTADDTLLAALPLSFDAGFSQLTTGFHAGARVVLLNYLMPRDVVRALERERVTGLTAVPPLWIQLRGPWGKRISSWEPRRCRSAPSASSRASIEARRRPWLRGWAHNASRVRRWWRLSSDIGPDHG
jgi:acyl-CoA synthetase (AMP-forming)/AMP-acid ligase II